MKTLFAFFALSAFAVAIPAKRVTNRYYPDGSGSSKEQDPATRESVETFYARGGKITHKVICRLDERLQPLSALFYDPNGRIYQKSTYRLDGEDRIVQEVIYDAKGNLLCTKNYNYGTRNGRSTIIDVDTYDSNGNLVQSPKQSRTTRKSR